MLVPTTLTGCLRTVFKLCILFRLKTKHIRVYESRNLHTAIIIQNERIGSFNVVSLLVTSQHCLDPYNVVITHQSLLVYILNIRRKK